MANATCVARVNRVIPSTVPRSPGLRRAQAHARARASALSSIDARGAKRLAKWLVGFGFSPLSLTLDDGNDGFGVRATCACDRGIARGDVVLSIPRDAMLDARSALGEVAYERARAVGLSPFQLLTVALLCECRLKESRWKPYLDTLPKDDALWHPLLWCDNDIEDVLPATSTHVGARLRGIVRACDEDAKFFRSIEIVEQSAAEQECWPSARLVRWAVAIVSSRAFRLNDLYDDEGSNDEHDEALLETLNDLEEDCWESGGGAGGDDDEFSVLALVPWADSLNHSSDAGDEAILTYDTQSRTATLRAHQAYAHGEQVFDSYGLNLRDEDLFVNYGFVDVQSSRENFVEFSGDEFLRAAGKIGARMKPESDTSFFDPSDTVLRVDGVVGVGENAMFFGECLLADEDVVENVVLQAFAQLLDLASARLTDDVVAKARTILGRVREGESLLGVRAAAYVVCREFEAVEAARLAVVRQLSECG